MNEQHSTDRNGLCINSKSYLCVLYFRDGKWMDACNTSERYCNIFSVINDPSSSVWGRVKVRVGQEESVYAQSKEFILCKEGE